MNLIYSVIYYDSVKYVIHIGQLHWSNVFCILNQISNIHQFLIGEHNRLLLENLTHTFQYIYMRVVHEQYLCINMIWRISARACVSYHGRRCVRATLGCWCSQTCSLRGCVLCYFLSQVCSVCETLAEDRYQSLWTSAPSEPRRSNQTHQTHCSTEPERADKNKNFKNTLIKRIQYRNLYTHTHSYLRRKRWWHSLFKCWTETEETEWKIIELLNWSLLLIHFAIFKAHIFFHADLTEYDTLQASPRRI